MPRDHSAGEVIGVPDWALGADLAIALLGALEVWSRQAPVRVPGARARHVLTLLAVDVGAVVSADRLSDELWGESLSAARDRTTLHVHVSNLRRALGPAAAAVVTTTSGYRLDPARVRVDIDVAEQLVERARRAEPAQAVGLLSDALGLWRGVPFDDLPGSPALVARRSRLDELHAAATETYLAGLLALDRLDDALGLLPDAIDRYPLRERIWSQYMLALYRSGRQADALRAFASARAVMIDELGVEPSPALRRIERAILLHSPTAQGLHEPGHAAMHWLDQDGRGRMTPLVADRSILIGRARDASIALTWDPSVSRRHAEVWATGDGWTIRDLGSTNGTHVNGTLVAGRHLLEDGDLVRCGESVLLVRLGGERSRSTVVTSRTDRRA